MLIKHLSKKEVEITMKRGKNVSTSSFLFKFTLDKPENAENLENPYIKPYFISALSPKAQFKTAVQRNKVRRKLYGAINHMNCVQRGLILRAIIIPNKTILDMSQTDLQGQILSVFVKIGV